MSLFFSTYFLIFLAELPDKTAFAALFLATRRHSGAIFLGSAAAFAVQNLIAITGGSLLALLPAQPVRIGAGLLFFVFAFSMWFRKDDQEEGTKIGGRGHMTFWKTAWLSFVAIFLAEWGDLTQLTTAALTAKHKNPLVVYLASTAALWTVTGLAVFLGNRAKKIINRKLLKKIGALAFAAVGTTILVQQLLALV